MLKDEKNFLINNPIFIKYRITFDFRSWKWIRYPRAVFMNERIIEVPFVIHALSALPRGSRVLDLGCAESSLPMQLAVLGYQVTGFDFRPYPYAHRNFSFVRGDFLQLPFENESYDAVLSISTIEHAGIGFYQDPRQIREADQKAVAQAERVLKKGGLFIFTAPYGIHRIDERQRVYDKDSLDHLVKVFCREETRYFKKDFLPGAACNTWVEIGEGEAATIESRDDTRCVCLARAKKCKN